MTLSCSLFACNSKDREVNKIQNTFDQNGIAFEKELKICLIIPGAGCEGCIASGIFFLKQHLDAFSRNQEDNIVIFSSITSQKLLERNFENNEWLELNKIIDTDNDYIVCGEKRIYPLVLYLDNGKIIDYAYQSPDSDALNVLQERLSTLRE